MQVWDTVQNRAGKVFESAFTTAMSKRYQLKKITEQFQLSGSIDSTQPTPSEVGALRGILLDCYYLKSPFHYIPIAKIHIYLNEPVESLPVFIYEVHDNKIKLLYTTHINGKAGWNDIELNEKYPDSAMLYVCYDASNVDSVSMNLDNQDLDGRFWASYDWYWSHIYVQGATYSNEQFKEGYDTYGMNLTIGLQCSYDVLIANYKRELAIAWWYLLGAELMQERIYTDRVNKFTVDLARAKDLRAQLKQDFLNELLTFVDSIHLRGDWCIENENQAK